MLLSEAIRLGAMATPPATGTSLDDRGGTCALGAALYAIGQASRFYGSACLENFPITSTVVRQPVSNGEMYLLSAVRELNDIHEWTRERIADWVQTFEPRETERCEESVAVHAVARIGERVTGGPRA